MFTILLVIHILCCGKKIYYFTRAPVRSDYLWFASLAYFKPQCDKWIILILGHSKHHFNSVCHHIFCLVWGSWQKNKNKRERERKILSFESFHTNKSTKAVMLCHVRTAPMLGTSIGCVEAKCNFEEWWNNNELFRIFNFWAFQVVALLQHNTRTSSYGMCHEVWYK